MRITKEFLETRMAEMERGKTENEHVVWRFERGILDLKMLLEELQKPEEGTDDDQNPSNV